MVAAQAETDDGLIGNSPLTRTDNDLQPDPAGARGVIARAHCVPHDRFPPVARRDAGASSEGSPPTSTECGR